MIHSIISVHALAFSTVTVFLFNIVSDLVIITLSKLNKKITLPNPAFLEAYVKHD